MAVGIFTMSMSFSAFAGNWLDLGFGWQYDKTGFGGLANNEWLWIDGNKDGIAECYYFDATGFMWHDREKDGYSLNSDGQWVIDGVIQTKQVEIDNSKTSDIQKLIEERNAKKEQCSKLNFTAVTTNEDKATGYTAEGLFDSVFRYHEYSRYDKLSNQNMTVLFYKKPYDDVYYSFKGNVENGKFLKLEEQDAINKATQEFLGKYINDKMSEYEKEQAIINYMIEHISYGDSANHSGDIYGGLILGKVVCGGYADTFAWLANAAGLNVLTVQGKAYGDPKYRPEHAWNLVQLDGKWYQVDVTFEDGSGAKGRYINITDEEMGKDHTWEQNGLPLCN